jgi:hypothetical protein
MSIGWNPKNLDFDNNLIQRCGGLLSIYFTPIFLCTIGICKHVHATSISDTSLDIINVEINFNYNNETFCSFKGTTLLTFNFIQP